MTPPPASSSWSSSSPRRKAARKAGFWLYHFDNPADDTDSADIPKVGYARIFAGGHLIINSGFYLSADSVFVRRILEALEEGQASILFGITTPGGGGCTVAPLLAGTGGPLDPTLPALVGLVLAWLAFGRGRPVRRTAMAGAALHAP